MTRTPSMKAAPAEACPNCGHWYVMGDCRHSSRGAGGVMYGVCSYCADARDEAYKLWSGTPDKKGGGQIND